jgi:hypothetical protein
VRVATAFNLLLRLPGITVIGVAFEPGRLLVDVRLRRRRLVFQRVPEPKSAKNRVHLDLQVGPDNAAGEVDRLVALGATVAWVSSDRGPLTTTLRDPEGNEFCVS